MATPRPSLTRDPRRLAADEARACGIGQGAACCVFLVVDRFGFECQQRGPLRRALLARVDQMVAKRAPESEYPACQGEGVGEHAEPR